MAHFESHRNWGIPPWRINFTPSRHPLPTGADIAVVGAGFSGLAAAAWIRSLAPRMSVVVLEASHIGAGASGRTGGIALAETAAGDFPGLGDVLAGFSAILKKLGVDCDLSLSGAWEIGRRDALEDSEIQWNDSGPLQVFKEVPGGSVDPGKLVSGLGRAAQRLGATIIEDAPVLRVEWGRQQTLKLRGCALRANRILFATNAFSLDLIGLGEGMHPRLTLAVATAPLTEQQLKAIGLATRKPFYTVDLPYLWGRVCRNNSLVLGAGLVQAQEAGNLERVDIAAEEPSAMFSSLEERIRGLHPALNAVQFTHRWGGPILFRDGWHPILTRHPENPNSLVLGAYAGHGVALSVYFGVWAAETLLGRRDLPAWAAL